MSGVDLCRAIHKLRPDLPVVLMTAFSVESVVREAVNEGAMLVLPKPFAIEHLVRILMSAMRRPVVLVVDDVPEVAETMIAALHAVGLPARSVYDGQSALDAFRAGDISVCIVDMVMPGLSGADVIERLRGRSIARVVVIAVSGHDVDELFRRISRLTDTFLRKPVDPARAAPGDRVGAAAQHRKGARDDARCACRDRRARADHRRRRRRRCGWPSSFSTTRASRCRARAPCSSSRPCSRRGPPTSSSPTSTCRA